jgi:hypothetical protein
MSLMAHRNYHRGALPGVQDQMVRTMTLDRSDERFFSELGAEPITQSGAYQLGCDGADTVWLGKKRGIQAVLPAIGADSFRAFDSGLVVYEACMLSYCDDAYYNERDYFYAPEENAQGAFTHLEFEKQDQEQRMWDDLALKLPPLLSLGY